MTPRSPHALVLFARDPEPGRVKTRLHSVLDEDTVCQLYIRFLEDSVETLRRVPAVDRFIGVYPSAASGFFSRFQSSGPLTVYVQEGDNLGDRMRDTFARRFEEGYQKVVIVGSDSPTLPASYIERGFASDKEVVIGPCTDGGYYLVGMHRKVTEIFKNVPWGTDRVLQITAERVRAQGAALELLPVWYDVDRPEDLEFLKTHLDLLAQAGRPGAVSTGRFLKQRNL